MPGHSRGILWDEIRIWQYAETEAATISIHIHTAIPRTNMRAAAFASNQVHQLELVYASNTAVSSTH